MRFFEVEKQHVIFTTVQLSKVQGFNFAYKKIRLKEE